MNKLPLLKFDVNAWLTGKIQLLSAAEKGIFIDIVARIWMTKNQLKNDDFLHRLIRVEKGTLSEALRAFFELGIMEDKSGFLCVKFVDTQIDSYESYVEQQRAFGAKGGRPKKGTEPGVFKERKKKKQKEKSTKKERINNKKVKKDISPLYPPNGGDGYGVSISQESLPVSEEPEWLEHVEEVTENDTETDTPDTTITTGNETMSFSDTFIAMKHRISGLFNRQDSTPWDAREVAALQKIISGRSECMAELESIEQLYYSGYQYRRHDIKTFLNNWSTEFDRSLNANNRRSPGI